MRFHVTMGVTAGAVLWAAPAAPGQILSTFDTSNDGWKVVGLNPIQHAASPTGFIEAPFDATDGRPPGSIRIDDPFFWTFVAAPAQYLGDFSSAYGGTVEFDMLVRSRDVSGLYPVIALVGARITLYYSVDVSEIATGEWTEWSVELAPGPWVVDHYETGPAATEAEIREVLADVAGLYIDTEYRTGPDDTSLDNILLGGTDCYADCNRSGDLDFFDFLCFQNAFAAGDPAAECDASGVLDFFDFLCFQNAFAAGCP